MNNYNRLLEQYGNDIDFLLKALDITKDEAISIVYSTYRDMDIVL